MNQNILFYILKKPTLNELENIELEDQQLALINLLNEFENYLEKIRDIFNNEQTENTNEDDDSEWIDIDGEEDIHEKRLHCNKTNNMDNVKSQISVSN